MENIVNNMNNMNNSEKKNKPNICSVDEYMNNILIKIEKMMPVAKKTGKISDDNIIIPTIKNYDIIFLGDMSAKSIRHN